MNSSWVNIVFKRFSSVYHGKWLVRASEAQIASMAQEWASTPSLQNMDDIWAMRTVEKCKEQLDSPPSISKFVEIAKSVQDEKDKSFRQNLSYSNKSYSESFESYVRRVKVEYGKEIDPVIKQLARQKISGEEWCEYLNKRYGIYTI